MDSSSRRGVWLMISDKTLQQLLLQVGHAIETEAATIAPKDKGRLAGDIQVFDDEIDQLRVSIGNSSLIPYALFVHEGTGIHGKYKRRITPKKAKALKTPWGYRKSIAGQKAQPYLSDALENILSSGVVDNIIESFGEDVTKEIRNELRASLKNASNIKI